MPITLCSRRVAMSITHAARKPLAYGAQQHMGASPTGLELVHRVKPRREAEWPKRRPWTGGRCSQPNGGPTATGGGGQAKAEPGRYWAPR